MYHFSVQFTHPWLLLLLIPAAALTVFLYLRLNKKFRRNRNRIVSVVLHSLVSILCVFALSGMTFHYDVNNAENELILLVDVSDTTEETKERRDEFIDSVLEESSYNGCRVGIVTFGFTQAEAVPLTFDARDAYGIYLDAGLPDDTSATDIAAALRYAHSMFEHPETGKILLISDGKQTDEEAISVIRSIAAQGVIVDTVYFPSDYSDDIVQISGIELPDYNVKAGEQCSVDVTVESKAEIEGVTIDLFDNGSVAEGNSITVDLVEGTQTVHFDHIFTEQGLHELRARLQYTNEALQQNNEYYAYRWLQIHNKILILEQADQSERLVDLLMEDEVNYEIDGVNIATGEGFTVEENGAEKERVSATVKIPASVDDLRKYDQVILNNIASKDLEPTGLDAMLYEYVNVYGGGVFTTGGMEDDGKTAHSYNRKDMNNTLFQQMLPVQAINYTPPLGVFLIIDISGSMVSNGSGGQSYLYWAKQAAIQCLTALDDRDYIGVMTMDTEYGMVLDLTSCSERNTIKNRIDGIGQGNSTIYSTAIDRAAQRLANLKNVDKRHIVLITDGLPSTNDETAYINNTRDAYENHGITLSVIGIEIESNEEATQKMGELVEVGHGRLIPASQGRDIIPALTEELRAPEIEEVKYGEFNPYIADALSPLLNGVGHGADLNNRHVMDATLGGFFGTKVRQSRDVDLVLVGEYEVPIYAQWVFGNGRVGSFMCDVYSDWSQDFMENPNGNGKKFLLNAIANLMPTDDIYPAGIRLTLNEDNYINHLNVFASLEDGEYLEGKITVKTAAGEETFSLNEISETESDSVYVTTALGADNGYARANFIIKGGGVYTITVTKFNADGEVLDTADLHKSFSYSAEYDFSNEQDPAPEAYMAQIAERGHGKVIAQDEPWEIFTTFVTDLSRVYDPRWLFIGLAMAFFLLDIAVRKFKFKWPHELIREHREKKAGKK